MITKTAVHYASTYLYKEAAIMPSWGGIKAGLGKVKNFMSNLSPTGGYNPSTIGAVNVTKAPLNATYARPMAQTAPSRMSNRIHNMSNFNSQQINTAVSKGVNLGQTRLTNNMIKDLNNDRSAISKSIARHAKKVRAQNSVPKKVNNPAPQQKVNTNPQQQQQVTSQTQQAANQTPQYTQEQMNAAKNSNLLGGAVIGAGALGGINYVGNRVFGPQRPQMMPMMMPMPMPMY